MSSIIKGYSYDIFISYRQKDNKHDGWVTEFVDNLKGELESTFKEEIGVYFDINPHDGLLETHDVDASLKDKLKCLIFIPIISQTYCDSKSFAWEHEFVAFNKLAKEDQFGRDIRLAGGNVASRILPIKINDIEPEDKTLLENELGGFIRGIEFIYKEPGVNRPLKPEDDEKKNLNNTVYRNQINKIANAVKEIIAAIKKHNLLIEEVSIEVVNAKPEKSRNLRTKIIIPSLIILALIVLGYFFIPKLFNISKPIEKSIAILPFINDSPDQENTYFINGIMDEILNNLQKIKNFRVLSRTSTEQYRGAARPSIPKIGKALNVNYIVEGSGQKYGNKFVLRVQLIAANNERHLWAKSYEKEIKETSDQISIQSEIAQSIAAELKVIITPEEKQLIEKTPTANLTAYDFYQRAREEIVIYGLGYNSEAALTKAENLYRKALEYDSTFAGAYSGLAVVYRFKHAYNVDSYFAENYLDSAMILANKALYYDDQLAEAYYTRGLFYIENGKIEQAIKEFDKALKYNPNFWQVYTDKAIYVYAWSKNYVDYIKALENLNKAISINHGKELPQLLRLIGTGMSTYAGFEKGFDYYEEAFKLDGDTNLYLGSLANREWYFGNREKAIELLLTIYKRKPNSINIPDQLGSDYMFLGQFKESLKYFKDYLEKQKVFGGITIDMMHYIGYDYWRNGDKKEAEYYFNEQKKICEESIKKGRRYSTELDAYYDLAGVYAFMGNKGKAYENLKIWDTLPIFPLWYVVLIKDDPLFDKIRNEPEFQQILRDVEAKYQAEHERVRKWLEGQGML